MVSSTRPGALSFFHRGVQSAPQSGCIPVRIQSVNPTRRRRRCCGTPGRTATLSVRAANRSQLAWPRHMPALGRPLHSRLRRLARSAGFSADGASRNVTLPGRFLPGDAAPGGDFGWAVAAWAVPKQAAISRTATWAAMRDERRGDMATPCVLWPPCDGGLAVQRVTSCPSGPRLSVTHCPEKNPASQRPRGVHAKERQISGCKRSRRAR